MALTIRLDAEEEKLILKLQQHFNVKTASKAMLAACQAYENEWKKIMNCSITFRNSNKSYLDANISLKIFNAHFMQSLILRLQKSDKK